MPDDDDWSIASRIPTEQELRESEPRPFVGEGFELVEELGRGAMGVVWRARDPKLRRDVAIKVLSRVSPRGRARLALEAAAIGKLDHPNIVRIHSIGEHDEKPYLVLQLVEGATTLGAANRTLSLADQLDSILTTATALGHAHERGLVHRDVKPSNVLIDHAGHVYLSDFGLVLDREAELERLTLSGALVGTPCYMAPEQLETRREDVGPHSDVFALGVMLYEALTGVHPHNTDSLAALLWAIKQPPRVPSTVTAHAYPSLDAVCMRALAWDPEERYSNGREFALALEAGIESPGSLRLSPRWPALLAGGLLTLGVILYAATPTLSASLDARPLPDRSLSPGPASSLRLDTAREQEVWLDHVIVSGVTSGEGEVEVSLGSETLRATGPRFSVRVPLKPGTNRILVGLSGGALSERSAVTATRRVPPEWFSSYQHPPALPLPEGVRFGEGWGEFVNAKDESKLVWVEPGEFLMGERAGDLVHDAPVSLPPERVRLEGYFMGKFEVTRGQVDRYLRANQLPPRYGTKPTHPASAITWDEAQAYCKWAGMRLPSEAEWEFAARGPKGRRYPWGSTVPTPQHCNSTASQLEHTLPIGSCVFGESPSGCQDMAGNVSEWVVPHVKTPLLESRILKGGSFTSSPGGTRSARRKFKPEDHSRPWVGFRACRPPE